LGERARTRTPELAAPLALVLGAVLVLHGRTLSLPFCADDFLFLDVARTHPGVAALTAADPIGNFYRPISRGLYFGIVAPLTGESTLAFHAINLFLFAATIGLFAALARRLLPDSAAARRGVVAGTAFLALHYAFDVPVMWASGIQDLLAIPAALGALLLFERRPAIAAGLLFLGLLSKEAVAPCALVAVLLGRARGEVWPLALRRATPLIAATAVWAVLWISMRTLGGARSTPVSLSLGNAVAAVVHGVQVALGLEISAVGGPRLALASLVAVILAVAATLLVRERRRVSAKGKPAPRAEAMDGSKARGGVRLGLAWALLGSAPIALVAPIWSAYYYGFALCGVALALAAALVQARRPAWAAAAVAVLGLASGQARAVEEFGPTEGAWTAHSHVNRHYFDRAMAIGVPFMRDLRRLHPRIPPRSTFYFLDIPSFAALQAGDGPLVRWVYRDSTLRSFYFSQFRVPDPGTAIYVIHYEDGRLTDIQGPTLFGDIGGAMVEIDRLDVARDAFRFAESREPASAQLIRSWLPWVERALADSSRGAGPVDPAHASELVVIRTILAGGDSATAYARLKAYVARAPEDPAGHGLIADIAMNAPSLRRYAVYQAFVARTLAPRDPSTWRRWAILLAVRGRQEPALAAIGKMRALAGDVRDPEIDRLEAALRAHLPGGAIAREALRSAGVPAAP